MADGDGPPFLSISVEIARQAVYMSFEAAAELRDNDLAAGRCDEIH